MVERQRIEIGPLSSSPSGVREAVVIFDPGNRMGDEELTDSDV